MIESVPPAIRPVDFGTRFSAFMIDAAMLFAAQWIVFIVVSRQLQAVGMTSTEPCSGSGGQLCDGPSTALWVVLVIMLLVSTVGYYAWFEGRVGATPGKRWMGLEVTGLNGESPIGLVAGFIRAVVRQSFWLSLFFLIEPSPLVIDLPAALFLAIPALALVGTALGGLRPDGRSVHDLAAGTVVIRSSERTPDRTVAADQITHSTAASRTEDES